jgi:hypothetical protein
MRLVSSRLSRTATVAAIAVAAGLTAVAPAAHAATPAPAPQPAVKVTLGAPAPHGPLLPGGMAETFTVTATNTTGKAQIFDPAFVAAAQGPLGLLRSDVKFSIAPVHGAPAASFDYGTQDGSLFGGIVPKGGKAYRSHFTVPAHFSYTWKVSVAAGATWQANDNALAFTMGNIATKVPPVPQTLIFKVGKARTGGPVTVSFSGASKLVLGKFENVDVTLTNRSGARLNLSINDQLNFGAYTVDGKVAKPAMASADIQILENGHWVALGKNHALPTLAGLANGTSHTFHLRVRLTGFQTTIKGGTTKSYIGDIAWNPARGPIARLGETLNIAKS